MGMNTYYYGLKDPTERYLAMKAVRDNCSLLGIEEPAEVEEFLDGKYGSSEGGERVEIPQDAVSDYDNPAVLEHGIEVELEKLPSEIKKIRFVNSW